MEKSFSMDLPSAMERLKIEKSRRAAMASQEEWERSRSDEGGEKGSDTLSRGDLASGNGPSEEMGAKNEEDEETVVTPFKHEREVAPEKIGTFSAAYKSNPSLQQAYKSFEAIKAMRSNAEIAFIDAGRINVLDRSEAKNSYDRGLRIFQIVINTLERRLQEAEQEKSMDQMDSFESLKEEVANKEEEMRSYLKSTIEDAWALHQRDQEAMAQAITKARGVAPFSLSRK